MLPQCRPHTPHHHARTHAGKRIQGKVVVTISRGRVVWEGGALHVQPGTGRFLPLPPFGPLFEGLGAQDERASELQFPYGATPVLRGGGSGGAEHQEL